ncbi:hypothetical protein ACFUV2_02060 [Streptomyces pilosus]|uniref:hypothetical protein n=1 Tax=Streptomyces pilosus TaxID=28893 RepID=UPI003641DBA8
MKRNRLGEELARVTGGSLNTARTGGEVLRGQSWSGFRRGETCDQHAACSEPFGVVAVRVEGVGAQVVAAGVVRGAGGCVGRRGSQVARKRSFRAQSALTTTAWLATQL